MDAEIMDAEVETLSPSLLQKINAYWRAANYLVGRAALPATIIRC